MITRAFGARDMALGAGALSAFGRGQDARDWVAASAAADVADLVTTLASDDVPTSGRLAVLAMASAAIGVSAAYLAAGE